MHAARATAIVSLLMAVRSAAVVPFTSTAILHGYGVVEAYRRAAVRYINGTFRDRCRSAAGVGGPAHETSRAHVQQRRGCRDAGEELRSAARACRDPIRQE